jgi:hypothetical protein
MVMMMMMMMIIVSGNYCIYRWYLRYEVSGSDNYDVDDGDAEERKCHLHTPRSPQRKALDSGPAREAYL